MPIKSADQFNKFSFISNKTAPLGEKMAEEIARSRAGDTRRADAVDAQIGRPTGRIKKEDVPKRDVYHTQEVRSLKRIGKLAANVPTTLHGDRGSEYSVQYKSLGQGKYKVQAKPNPGTPPPIDPSVLELGTLLVGDARFELGTPAGNGRKVFTRIGDVPGSAVQFVQDSKGQMIRRYQVRYMNKHDLEAFNNDRPITSKQSSVVPEKHMSRPTPKEVEQFGFNEKLNEEKQILAHTTWGSQRFVSLTSTARPILGSGGKNFDGTTGYIVVDMAQISQKQTLSLHSSSTLAKVVQAETVDDLYVRPFEPETVDEADTEFNARATIKADAIRTKEVLVREIPVEAVVAGRSMDGDIVPDRFADKDLRALFAKLPENHY